MLLGWLTRLSATPEAAEALQVEVGRRLDAGGPGWLEVQPLEVRQRFFVVQVVLEQRGVLPSSGRPSSDGADPRGR